MSTRFWNGRTAGTRRGVLSAIGPLERRGGFDASEQSSGPERSDGMLDRASFWGLLLLASLTGCVAPADAEPRRRRLDAASDSLPGGATGGPFDTCLLDLEGAPVERVAQAVARRFRLQAADTTDVARDAMLKVYVRHAVSPYDRLEAALQQAAFNQASRGWSRRKRLADCPVETVLPACDPRQSETVRFESELRAASAALCQESALDDRILQERVIDQTPFDEIGAGVGITADQARTRYHNAMRRVKLRAEQGLCRAR